MYAYFDAQREYARAGSQRRRRPRIRPPFREQPRQARRPVLGRRRTASPRARRDRCSIPAISRTAITATGSRSSRRRVRRQAAARAATCTRGHLANGFALVAWPARYGETGVMSFLVNHDGVVYQKNLGAAFGSRRGRDDALRPGRHVDAAAGALTRRLGGLPSQRSVQVSGFASIGLLTPRRRLSASSPIHGVSSQRCRTDPAGRRLRLPARM